MKIFDDHYFNDLIDQAKGNPRLRRHRNIHHSYADPSQRLFNAIEPDSYIRPHRHATDPKDELLVAVRGAMALVIFDDQGAITQVLRFGTERLGNTMAVGVEIPCSTWHTVIALEPGSVLLEVKSGPFDPNQPKDFAVWAPEEGTTAAQSYLLQLRSRVNG
jgi:cupin fold WbuC family metalloprotein